MTYTRQGRNDSIDSTVKQKIWHENRKQTDNRTTKKFLTNSDKSVFNLKWEAGGVARENYERSRSYSQHDTYRDQSSPRQYDINRDQSSPRQYDNESDHITSRQQSHKHQHHHHHHHHHHRHHREKSTKRTTVTPQEPPAEPTAYYYPFAYPPMPVYEQPVQQPVAKRITRPQKTNRETATRITTTTIKTGIKQSDKSINLIRNDNRSKIHRHYVDSDEQAQRVINDLRRKGFVETTMETSDVYTNDNRKKYNS